MPSMPSAVAASLVTTLDRLLAIETALAEHREAVRRVEVRLDQIERTLSRLDDELSALHDLPLANRPQGWLSRLVHGQ